MVYTYYSVLYGGFENEKKKGKKKFDLPERRFEPRIFEQFFPPLIWIFREGEGDEIKSRQPSKRDKDFNKYIHCLYMHP